MYGKSKPRLTTFFMSAALEITPVLMLRLCIVGWDSILAMLTTPMPCFAICRVDSRIVKFTHTRIFAWSPTVRFFRKSNGIPNSVTEWSHIGSRRSTFITPIAIEWRP